MTNWKTYKLSEVVDKRRGISYGIVQPGTFVDDGVPIIKVNNLTDKKLSFLDLQKVKPEVEAKYQRTKLRGNEILISLVGTLGHIAKVNQEMIGWNVARAVGVLPIADTFDKEWIYWFLKSPQAQNFVHGQATTSVQATLNLKELQELQIAYPDEEYRKKATEILSALDDKIELNRRMNQTLEQMAQTLFRKYFVDGIDEENLPEGWRLGTVREICTVNSKTLSKNDKLDWLDYVEISAVGKGLINSIANYKRGEEPSRARRKLTHGDTVLSTVRPDRGAYFLAVNTYENLVASTGFAVFTATKVPYSFLYLFLTQEENFKYYGFIANGAAYPAINPESILAMESVIPTQEVLAEFHAKVEPLLLKYNSNNQEAKILSTLRDTLLPKLMSGEMDVMQTKPEELHEPVLS